MAERKRKAVLGLQETFETIQDLLATTKPKLDGPNGALRASLVDDLHQVVSLAESFTEQRPRSNKNWIHLADTLDREGVNLWNISGLVRKTPEDDGRALVAALRLAGFRLIEAGLEVKPGIETILHVLQLASKTGATLSELGIKDVAASVLTTAAKFEELLRNADDPNGIHRKAKACATIVYFTSRMEAAWKEGNYSVAEFMSQKITEHDDQRLALLPPHDRELLASKLHDIGKSMVRGDSREGNAVADASRAHAAVRWLQKAFSLAEQLEDSVRPGITELRISILRTLARAYFLSSSHDPENLSRAEATLEELIPAIDASTDHVSSDYQELRWLRLAVLKRKGRNAGESTLLDAYKSIIDHMSFTDSNITDILQDLRTLSQQHALVTAVIQYCLQRVLEQYGPKPDYPEFVDRLLLSLIFHCSKDQDHARAMKDMITALNCTSEAEFELLAIPTAACLTLIWQYGDRHYHAKRWSEAADWFMTGSHQIFRSADASSSNSESKCFRKAALCYIEQREYATASTVIRRCPTDEAATHYVILLTAAHQGLEDEAIKAIQDMVKAPDFDRKMLLLATQLSHESEMKSLLLAVLEALLKTLRVGNSDETAIEAMSLIRCIIRLVLKLLVEPAADKPLLINRVVEHFLTAKTLTEAAIEQKAISMIIKDVSWLWRTAYNCAVQGCSEWADSEEQVSELFDISRQLLEAYCQASPVDVDAELYLHLVNASFSAVSGRVFALRRAVSTSGKAEGKILRGVTAEIKACKDRISAILGKNKISDESDILRVQSFNHILRIFEVELLSQAHEWEQLLQLVEELVQSDASAVVTFEAIADILWAEQECPVAVLYTALEAILHASLDRNHLSVEKFSRWLRAICTIILSRNASGDRAKAIGYVEQALAVMEDNEDGDDRYPMDERQWLLGTSYNTGIECLHASLLDEAKRWFESSTVICRFVPDGKSRAEKISETYMHLLARYSRA